MNICSRILKFLSSKVDNDNCNDETKSLYHYTSFNSFNDIISTNTFLFSRLENANDFRERYVNISNYIDVSNAKFICCTDSYKNDAMWYHYANKWDGVCIQFDFSKLKNIEVRKIVYLDPIKRENQTKLCNTNCSPTEYLSIKNSPWSYEKEIRLFVADKAEKLNNIKQYITDVYIGDKFRYDDTNEETLLFLKELKEKEHLWSLPKAYGFIKNAMPCQSPRLTEILQILESK